MTLVIRSREQLEQLVVHLHYNEGWTIRALVRHLGMGRNTIRRILRRNEADRRQGVPATAPARARASMLDGFEPRIESLVARYPNITGQRLFEELAAEGFTGGITIVRQRLRKLRPKPKKEPVIRFETDPGRQGQMDWSPYKIAFTRDGLRQVLCFSYILGFSRRQYIDFTTDRRFFTLIRRHIDAFAYFKGVCAHCLYDNEKTVVLRWEAGAPVYNPAFSAFATHYRFAPVACHPGRPQTKGKVEQPFWYVERNLLNARKFEDLEDLRQTARWWMTNRCDTHVHDTTGRTPLELFLAEEQAALVPLPDHGYDDAEVALRVCRSDGLVEFEANTYSVPYAYVADILTVKATEAAVTIYDPHLKCIAGHQRLPAGAGLCAQDPQHSPAKKMRYGLEPVASSFLALGEHAGEFLQGLQQSAVRNAGFHVRMILALKQRYHCDDIHAAIKHANAYRAFDHRSIEHILAARASVRTLESIRNRKARQILQSALPQIVQRPLAEYNRLVHGALDPETSDDTCESN